MRWLYPRTREREIAWKLGAAILAGSLLLAPFVMLIFEGKEQWSFFTVRPCPSLRSVLGPATNQHLIVGLGFLANSRIDMRLAPAPSPPTNERPDCHRFILPHLPRFLSRPVLPELDLERVGPERPEAERRVRHFRHHSDGPLFRFLLGVLHATTG